MQSKSVKLRIRQVCLLVVLALFVASFTQWEHGLWIAISVAAIVGPFSTALTIQKAANRTYGTAAGLLLSAVLQFYLRYEYHSIFLLGIVIAYSIGFSVQQNYRFFIMVVTATVCLNFGYMNLAFTTFEPLSFLVARLIAVFVGIMVFMAVQRGVYGERGAKVELHDALKDAAGAVYKALSQAGQGTADPIVILDIATSLHRETSAFDELCAASAACISSDAPVLAVADKVKRLKNGCLEGLAEYAGRLATHTASPAAYSARLARGLALADKYRSVSLA